MTTIVETTEHIHRIGVALSRLSDALKSAGMSPLRAIVVDEKSYTDVMMLPKVIDHGEYKIRAGKAPPVLKIYGVQFITENDVKPMVLDT